MNYSKKLPDLIESKREKLFFVMGKLLALSKTSSEQQHILEKIKNALMALESQEMTLLEDHQETQKQLNCLYVGGFVQWGLTNKKIRITNKLVEKKGQLFFDDKKSGKSTIPHNLKKAFNEGWIASRKKAA